MSLPVPVPSGEDPTVYPEEERVGEEILQRWILELLRPLIERWFDELGEPTFVGADQFIYYKQHDPHQRVAPDIYVLPGVEPDRPIRSWKTWESGIVPSFALEVVSSDWEKDYVEVAERYAVLGVPEVLVFDPHFEEHRDGARWQRFERVGSHFRKVQWTNERRIRSSAMRAWLRAEGDGQRLRLRIGTGKNGDVLFPTAAEAERQAKEFERQAKEAERQAKEAERQGREAAEARIAELEAELQRRR